MATLSYDFKIGLKAYPYVVPQTPVPTVSSDGGASVLDALVEAMQTTVTDIGDAVLETPTVNVSSPSSGDTWKSIDRISDVLFPKGLLKNIDAGLSNLAGKIKFLEKILGIMQLFMVSFNAIQTVLSTLVNTTVKALKEFSTEGLNFGIFINFIAPPALLSTNLFNAEASKQLRGGFPAFISRLQSSMTDPTDTNRPVFRENDYIAGWVILIDTEKIDELWASIRQLGAFFQDLAKTQIMTAPPPPNNLSGVCGYFDNATDETLDLSFAMGGASILDQSKPNFGIQLEWDNNYLTSHYRISRGIISGGQPLKEAYQPLTIMGDDTINDVGLFPTIKKMFVQIKKKEPVTLPERIVQAYRDPFFGVPKIIPNVIGKTVTFTDYSPVGEITQFYYVVQSCNEDGTIVGPYSKELVVTVKKCNDMFSLSDVIEQPNGSFEYLDWGKGSVGRWSSIRAYGMIPWFKTFMDTIIEMVEGISSWTGSASDALSQYIKSLTARVQSVLNIIKVLVYFLTALRSFSFGPSIYLLKLGPKEGGVANFVRRISSAKLPGGSSFSGEKGITVGLVALYGATGGIVDSLQIAADVAATAASAAESTANLSLGTDLEKSTSDAAKSLRKTANQAQKVADEAKQKQIKIMSTAFDFIFKVFPSKTIANKALKKVIK